MILCLAEYLTETATSAAAALGMQLSTPRPAMDDGPVTVGMSRRAALEAKRAWRLQERGIALPPDQGLQNSAAGMGSEHCSRTVRGHVGPLDPESAAEYNLQVKLAKGAAPATPLPSGEMRQSAVALG